MSLARILVVDDESSVRFFLRDVLESEAYVVEAVSSGEEALRLIETDSFDLIFLDLKMQGISGIEVLQSLRHQAPETTVIILTAHGSMETAIQALRHGAHDYLLKPCQVDDLLSSVQAGLQSMNRVIRQQELLLHLENRLTETLATIRGGVAGDSDSSSQARPGAVSGIPVHLEHHGLVVDMVRHTAYFDGKSLEFSPTELALLAFLIRQAPRVVSSDELATEVQEYHTDGWEARETVRYHIYRIRQKLQAAGGHKDFIRTVRGVGYALKE